MKMAAEKAERLASSMDASRAETKELCWDAPMVVGREFCLAVQWAFGMAEQWVFQVVTW